MGTCRAVRRKCNKKRAFMGWRCEPKRCKQNPRRSGIPTSTFSPSPEPPKSFSMQHSVSPSTATVPSTSNPVQPSASITSTATPSESPSISHSVPPAATPSGSEIPRNPEMTSAPSSIAGRSASVYTDPHVRTFDGLLYDCMASGEFTLVKTLNTDFEIQARFVGEDTFGSVTKGVAMKFGPAPVLQFTMATSDISQSTSLKGCPVLFYVDGVPRDLQSSFGEGTLVNVTASASGSISVSYPNALEVNFFVQTSSFFGCYFESVNVFIPETFIRNNRVIGILGSPNGNVSDEWMTQSGRPLNAPRSQEERLFEKAYNYCTRNWCVKEEPRSLFTYEPGSSHSTFNRCNVPYPTPPDLSSVSSALQSLCGSDTACLIDGIVGGIEDAENALTVQADVDRRSSVSLPFRFRPVLFQVGDSVNVKVTLDVSSNGPMTVGRLNKFNVYRADNNSGQPTSSIIVELRDNGDALNSDDLAGDLIFTNVVAVESNRGGEVFPFVAFPVINGRENRASPLAATALNAVRSYSRESGISSEEDTTDVVSSSLESLAGLELIVAYSWPRDESDLDTGTEFLGDVVGFSCGESPYMEFSGDDTSGGGTETVVIDLEQSQNDGKWSDRTRVTFRAGWYKRVAGPATLRMALRNRNTKREVSGTGLATVISPGSQSDCASKIVAVLTIRTAEEVMLSLTLE